MLTVSLQHVETNRETGCIAGQQHGGEGVAAGGYVWVLDGKRAAGRNVVGVGAYFAEQFNLVDVLVSSVVSRVRASLRILVCHAGSDSCHDLHRVSSQLVAGSSFQKKAPKNTTPECLLRLSCESVSRWRSCHVSPQVAGVLLAPRAGAYSCRSEILGCDQLQT